jgi:hypothetical protein
MFHYLLSYHYYKKTDLDELAEAAGDPELTFLADSGAFSAFTSGAEVTLDEYAVWLKRWQHRLHAYANLDILQDPAGSAANLQRLRDHGLDPMPVFHVGEPLDTFTACLESAPYVAVGGLVNASVRARDARLWRYLAGLHAEAQEAGVKLHGFGLSSWPLIRRFPWYSVDSSTPGLGYRYGVMKVYDPYGDRIVTWGLHDRKKWQKYGWLVREYGMRPEDFRGTGPAIRGALIAISARSWAHAARQLADTRVYITDGAFGSGEPSHGKGAVRIGAFHDGNRWEHGTRLYVTDPHPSATKNVERIAGWQAGNTWTPEQQEVAS